MIDPDKAWDIISAKTAPLPVVTRPLAKALHCVLAKPVCADRDMPPADRSAMDGYAVRADDIKSTPVDLRLCGEIAAGSDAAPNISAGTCARIFTGANVPPGADTVVMVEDTEEGDRCSAFTKATADKSVVGEGRDGSVQNEEAVTFLKPVAAGANIFRRGENAGEGEVLIDAGTRIAAGHIGVCAAAGAATLQVYRRPTVSILATGQELLDVSARVKPHQLRNSNGPMLVAVLQSDACEVLAGESVPDDVNAIVAAIKAALTAGDLVILTGGVSVGKYDLVPEAVVRVGATVHFHGVAMKPGKPLLFATSKEGKCIFGLPGNPLSAMTGFYEFVMPTLSRLAGLSPTTCRPSLIMRVSKDVFSKGDRQRYVLGQVLWNANGPEVEPVESHGTADVVAGAKAHGVIVMPADVNKAPAGSLLEFRPWRVFQ